MGCVKEPLCSLKCFYCLDCNGEWRIDASFLRRRGRGVWRRIGLVFWVLDDLYSWLMRSSEGLRWDGRLYDDVDDGAGGEESWCSLGSRGCEGTMNMQGCWCREIFEHENRLIYIYAPLIQMPESIVALYLQKMSGFLVLHQCALSSARPYLLLISHCLSSDPMHRASSPWYAAN